MKDFFNHQLLPLLLRHAAAMVSIALTAWVLKLFEPFLEIQLIALLFLLPVMLSTVLWGITPGILAGFLAFLSFNYFFIQPYYTLAVHKNQDVITLIVFLIVVVVMSNLIGRAREGMHLARSREREATRMYELISALAGLQDANNISQVLANQSRDAFNFVKVLVKIYPTKDLPEFSFTSNVESDQNPAENSWMRTFSIKTARGQEGEMSIWRNGLPLSPEENRLLEAFTSQAALALERVRLSRIENKTRILEESDHLKTSLLNSVSHELRSPLAAIKASVSSLRSGTVDWNTDARIELLATIEEETDQLNSLVGNLLDMSRIESGALKPLKRWNSIYEIAMGVVTKMRKQLAEYQLEIDFPANLPLIATDYVLISQVFSNLLSNSIKYAAPGTHIELTARQESDWLHVQVRNESLPVPPEHLERIFEKFYRINEADRVTGTGLGLSICKGIIEAHGGKIWGENQTDRFVFHFTLPLAFNGNLPQYPLGINDE